MDQSSGTQCRSFKSNSVVDYLSAKKKGRSSTCLLSYIRFVPNKKLLSSWNMLPQYNNILTNEICIIKV